MILYEYRDTFYHVKYVPVPYTGLLHRGNNFPEAYRFVGKNIYNEILKVVINPGIHKYRGDIFAPRGHKYERDELEYS